jgi:hypothetical protein
MSTRIERAMYAPTATPTTRATNPSNSRAGADFGASKRLASAGNPTSDTTALAAMIIAMTRYTCGQLPHWSAQTSAMPPEITIASR